MGVDKKGRGSKTVCLYVTVMATKPPSADHDQSEVFRRFYSKIEAVLDPAAVARLLWQGGVLTDAQLDEAEHESTSLAQRKSDIMSAVRKVVRGDSRKIWVLVSALEKFPASCHIARRMRKELNDGMTADAKMLYLQMQQLEVTLVLCKPASVIFRLRFTTHVLYPAAAMVVHMPEVYQGDFEDLQGQFVRLFAEVTEEIKKDESVTAENLKEFLSYYPDLEASLVNAHNISDMMRILKNHSTFICCSRLKNVAEHFKISSVTQKIKVYISSVTEKIKVYFQYLEDFCSRILTKHIYLKPFITAESMEFAPPTTLTFKLEWNPDDKTMSDIQGVIRRAFHEHSVYVHIVVVRGGSVRVICCAPQYLMTELVRLAQKNRELLVESSVTYLRVGDTIVVDTSDQNEVRICYHRNCVTLDFY